MKTKSDAGTQPAQHSMFGVGEDRMSVPQRRRDYPTLARERLNDLLAVAQAAALMPWTEQEARTWQTVFPTMARWLPLEEAEGLHRAFTCEMERLRAAG